MGQFAERLNAMWRNAGTSARCAVRVGVAVLIVGALCAGILHIVDRGRPQERFESEVQRLCDVMTLQFKSLSPEVQRQVLLAETLDTLIERLAIGRDGRILLAGHHSLEGQDAAFALGLPDLNGRIEALADHQISERSWVADGVLHSIQELDAEVPTQWLYAGASCDVVSRAVAQRAATALWISPLLAVVSALATYVVIKRGVIQPLRRMVRDAAHEVFHRGANDELADLVAMLQTLKQRRAQSSATAESNEALVQAREAIRVETELLGAVTKELRGTMSAVLGYVDLLATSDPRVAARINYIRGIQAEAQRLSRLAHRLNRILPDLTGPNEGLIAEDDLEQLRDAIGRLQDEPPGLQLEPPMVTDIPMELSEHPTPIKHLRGSVLVVGRTAQLCKPAVAALNELDLDAVWVPDLAAAETEMAVSDYDVVLVQLARRDDTATHLIERLREVNPQHGLVALLPDSARGVGQEFIDLGCDDYLFAPIARNTLLTVVGKYLDFEHVQE
jgi:CheY-like chemotaxis protein